MQRDEALEVLREYADSVHAHRLVVCEMVECDRALPSIDTIIESARASRRVSFMEGDER